MALTNTWGRVKIYCLNHDEPSKMYLFENLEKIKTPFYRCQHDDCPNRLNLDDYQGLILKFLDDMEAEPTTDFTNYGFSYRGARQKINCRVLKFSDKEIRIGILNTTVLGKNK